MSDQPAPNPETPPSTGRRFRWLLIASLAVNLLVFGAMAGAWVFGHRHGHMRGWGPTPMEHGLMFFSRSLPEERRDMVRKHLKDGRAAAKPIREELRQARLRAAEILMSPDFTTDKLKAAMDAIGAADQRMRQNGADVVVKAVEGLNPEERKSLGQHWQRRLQFEDRRRKRSGKDAPPGEGGPD